MGECSMHHMKCTSIAVKNWLRSANAGTIEATASMYAANVYVDGQVEIRHRYVNIGCSPVCIV